MSATHRVTARELATMSLRRFLALLGEFPPDSRFSRAWRATPRQVTDPNEIARLTGQ